VYGESEKRVQEAGVCPNYKQGVVCPKQGNKIEVVVLNRLCILGFFLS